MTFILIGPTSPRSLRRILGSSTTPLLQNFLVLACGILAGWFMASSYLSASMLAGQDNHERFTTTTFSSSRRATSTSNFPLDRDAFGGHTDDNGWKPIHVFYGNTSHLRYASAPQPLPPHSLESTAWFSQVRQDELVSMLLHRKRNGYFVDLAANDAVRISNTYALERSFDWQGLCIEPNPLYWPGLSHRKCHVVAAVVGPERMQPVQFKFPNRQAPRGGIVGSDFDNKEPSRFGEDQARFTVTLLEILERFEAPPVIDYLSLDVEGAEYFCMQAFPFDRYRISVLTVERPAEKLVQLLQANDYVLLKQLKRWGETIWAHRSVENSLNKSALDFIDTEHYKYKEPK